MYFSRQKHFSLLVVSSWQTPKAASTRDAAHKAQNPDVTAQLLVSDLASYGFKLHKVAPVSQIFRPRSLTMRKARVHILGGHGERSPRAAMSQAAFRQAKMGS